MELKDFRIQNYRSINDSGPIDATRITAILGRNESGKSNLLRALSTLNPPDGRKALNPIKDFPRHRKLQECTDRTPVVDTTWSLDTNEQAKLAELWPRAAGRASVRVGRTYGAQTLWVLIDTDRIDFDPAEIRASVRKIVPAVKAKAEALSEPAKGALEAAADKFAAEMSASATDQEWAAEALTALGALRQALAAANLELNENPERLVTDLEALADQIVGDEAAAAKARKWIAERIPIFLYLDEYPEMAGHQDIAAYIARKSQGQLTQSDVNFEKMCKVAGLDPAQLHTLSQNNDQETRTQLANRAGSVITTAIRRLWKDRSLKVRFNLDAQHFDTLISDPNSTYDVEVNLNERSRGFQWFFAFYVTFAADTDGGEAEDAILLLDEPGLYLHARSQGDLLKHLNSDFPNQILYTTHSPFMVPTHRLDSVRTVSIEELAGTTVSNNPSGDARTLFPLQAALGYDLAQSLFVGPNNVIVEGVTDFWILSAVSAYLNDNGRIGLRSDITLTPAGGAQKVPYMTALLTSEELQVVVLLDLEKESQATKMELVRSKLLREQNILFVTEAYSTNPPKEADIEDLLAPEVFEALVMEGYAKEIDNKPISVNLNIPRIAKRFESALKDKGIEFHKTRPARIFLNKMAVTPDSLMQSEIVDRFERLFAAINRRFS